MHASNLLVYDTRMNARNCTVSHWYDSTLLQSTYKDDEDAKDLEHEPSIRRDRRIIL
jgi:hypothetical protein